MQMKKGLTPAEFVTLARSLPRDERTPYAFEKRIMARLGDVPVLDALAFWTQSLWKAILPCVGVMAIVGIISAFQPFDATTAEFDELDIESVVLEPTQISFDPPV